MSPGIMTKGELLILTAPSGTGKTTLIKGLLTGELARHGGIEFAVSHTTRPPREGEVDGKDYHFIDDARFQEMIDSDSFLEWAVVHNRRYGTSLAEVFPRLEAGIDVLLDVDVQGAAEVIRLHPEAHSIFILPPSYKDLHQRLNGRGLDSPDEIARRLAVSTWEIKQFRKFGYVMINDDLERTRAKLAAVILEKRARIERTRERAEQILLDFENLSR
jgi:guanylate kinase